MGGLDYQAKELACNQDKHYGNNVTSIDEMSCTIVQSLLRGSVAQ